jgi:prevent-host-death family protein
VATANCKAQFSALFRRARTEGPQVVTRQGKEQVVLLPAEQFAQLTSRVRQPKSLVRFFAESPLASVTLDLNRDPDSGREIKLRGQKTLALEKSRSRISFLA